MTRNRRVVAVVAAAVAALALLATARTFAGDLRAERSSWPVPVVSGPGPGDIELSLDPGRADLGGQGYQLRIGPGGIGITGRTSTGVFYGTRTVLQLLATSDTIPDGSTTDVPAYAERAVGVCACYTYDTDAWLDRLIKDMAYLKLDYLHLELKVKSTQYPGANTFSYYTPSEIERLVALATRYHVTIIPEINSPGHMDPYITNYPGLQLVGDDGTADPTRLDITNPAALTFYENLIDADLKLFPGKYWDMGADEYMVNSAYSDYPRLLTFAQQKYGSSATAEDAWVWFVNEIDAYVRSKGRTLRIWNDGLDGETTVPVSKDIIVEYWLPEPVTSRDLLDEGYTVLNASDALYYVEGGYAPDIQGLYESGWTPEVFPDQTVTAWTNMPGAELMVWPDDYGKETQDTTQTNLFLPLRFLSQTTSDGYYRLISMATGLCATVDTGTANPLGVIEQAGAPVSWQQCDTSAQTQKWQLEPVRGGYRIVNAITQEAVTGALVQEPRDVAADDVWEIR